MKAGLLTATLIGLATPALAQHDDNGDGKGWRERRGGEVRGGGNGGGNNGGGEARGRPDNGGGDRGGWNRQQSAAPVAPQPPSPQVMQDPRPQRDYPLRPAAPQTRGIMTAPSAPAPAAAAPERNWSGQARSNGGWQGGDRDRRDDGARNRGGNPDWRNRNNTAPDWQNRDNRADDRRGNDWRDRDDRDRNRDRDDWRRDRNDGNRDRDWRGNDRRPPVVVRPPVTNRWQGYRPWNNDWRRDQRYNWQYWRNSHRDIFRLPSYYAPYGWNRGYFRFSVGVLLDELLFDDTYWIDDPWRYRLPPVYGSLRWVRYYDDALLVDIRDGYVVDVIYDFFW
ncbi:MAG: RcnB family protein [Sphingobium sp.]|nr:RcnB family protein [Sphingobium sp.]